jgi:O-antigen/teichoic acid export membrane protein
VNSGELPPSDRLRAQLAVNTVAQVAGSFGGALIGLVTFFVLARGLGPSAYGDYTAATAYLFFPIVLVDGALTVGVVRDISAAPERTERAMQAFLPLAAAVSVVIIALLVAVGVALPFTMRMKVALLIGSIGAFLTLMTFSLRPYFQARLEMLRYAVTTVAGRIVTLALVFAAFALDVGFKTVVAATVVGPGVTFALQLVLIARRISIRPRLDTAYWRRLAIRSSLVSIASAISQMITRLDTMILALFRSPTEVGYYGAAYRFLDIPATAGNAVPVSVFPPAARLVAVGDDARVRELTHRAMDVLIAGTVPFMILMLGFPEEILRWTAGPEYVDGAEAVRILALALPLSFANQVLFTVHAAYHADRFLLAVAFIALAVTVVLALLLIPDYGFEAAAVVTVVVQGLVATVMGVFAARRYGVLPRLRYSVTVALAALPAIVVVLFLPGPRLLVAAAALVGYALVVLLAPGTVRDEALRLRAMRRARRV